MEYQKKFYPELESLRGIAALAVCCVHAKAWVIFSGIPEESAVLVDFLFVLSGFVIALNFSASISNFSQFKWYLVKRFFRVYPLFFVTSIFYVAPVLLNACGIKLFRPHDVFDPQQLILYLTLTFKWGFVNDLIYNRPSWSVSVEVLLYIIAGLLFLTQANKRTMQRASGVLIAVSFIVLAIYCETPTATGFFAPLRGIYSFFMGVIVFIMGKAKPKTVNGYVFLLASISTIVVLLWSIHLLYWVIFLFPVVWAAIIRGMINGRYPESVVGFLNTKPLLWLGKISYSIYLLHGAMIFATEKLLNKERLHTSLVTSVFGVVVLFVLTIVAASVTFLYVEIPGKNLYRLFKRNAKQQAIAVEDDTDIYKTIEAVK